MFLDDFDIGVLKTPCFHFYKELTLRNYLITHYENDITMHTSLVSVLYGLIWEVKTKLPVSRVLNRHSDDYCLL